MSGRLGYAIDHKAAARRIWIAIIQLELHKRVPVGVARREQAGGREQLATDGIDRSCRDHRRQIDIAGDGDGREASGEQNRKIVALPDAVEPRDRGPAGGRAGAVCIDLQRREAASGISRHTHERSGRLRSARDEAHVDQVDAALEIHDAVEDARGTVRQGREVEGEAVGPEPADQGVRAGASGKRIRAGASDQEVVARLADHSVVAVERDQLVVEIGTLQAVVPGKERDGGRDLALIDRGVGACDGEKHGAVPGKGVGVDGARYAASIVAEAAVVLLGEAIVPSDPEAGGARLVDLDYAAFALGDLTGEGAHLHSEIRCRARDRHVVPAGVIR